MRAGKKPSFLVLVTDTSINPAKSGIQTLVYGLIAGLRKARQPFHLVEWNLEKQALYRLRPETSARLGKPGESKFWPIKALIQPRHWPLAREAKARNYRLPVDRHPQHRDGCGNWWLLIPELMYLGHADDVVRFAKQARLRIAAIFHDAIPISHPHLVRPTLPVEHANYMRALAGTDAVLAVSRESADAFIRFAKENQLPHNHVSVCPESGQILGTERVTTSPASRDSKAIHLLCVSTLEPRKNHRTLIEAFEDFTAKSPDLEVFLHLVGDSDKAAPEITEFVTTATRRNPRIRWHGKISWAELLDLYHLTDFTVYPSFLEGFGLPIVESLWMGKPCICANFGAVQEIAAAGGCLMVDVCEPRALTDAIAAMAGRPELRQSLTEQAVKRPLRTWRDYAIEIRNILSGKISA